MINNHNHNKIRTNGTQYYQSEIEDSHSFGYEDSFCGVPQIIWHIQNVPTFQRKLLPPFALTYRDAGDSSFPSRRLYMHCRL
jgi:hypothetical protein